MQTTPKTIVVVLAVALLAAGSTLAGEGGTWVAEDGQTTDVRGAHTMMFVAENGGEAFNLSDLRDGETRTFGQGSKQVTAQRLGDVVTLSRAAEGDGKALEIKCTLPKDTCRIVTFGDQPEKVMVVVEKRRECVNGVGDCDADVTVDLDSLPAGETRVHAIVRKVECDDAGNCDEVEKVLGGPDSLRIEAEEGPHGNVMIVRSHYEPPDGQVLLRCPEGDATVHVVADEANDTFLCPKHSVPMQKVEPGTLERKIRVNTTD